MNANVYTPSDSLPSNPVPASGKSSVLAKQTIGQINVFDWKTIDSLRFVVQVGLTATILLLCVIKLVFPNGSVDSDKALYWGGLTSIVTWWMPSPGTAARNNKNE